MIRLVTFDGLGTSSSAGQLDIIKIESLRLSDIKDIIKLFFAVKNQTVIILVKYVQRLLRYFCKKYICSKNISPYIKEDKVAKTLTAFQKICRTHRGTLEMRGAYAKFVNRTADKNTALHKVWDENGKNPTL
ncbi:hypothetical protein [Ruminococcus sp. YE71]|uniref:hypothetical protein n=1 Tax=Ruminococcus sp. YE71 TaxID=244362 RepID=UPI000931C547|nr:hypothetical protein [Ruminococcus sp. YE71]